jgi:hypothetical protein
MINQNSLFFIPQGTLYWHDCQNVPCSSCLSRRQSDRMFHCRFIRSHPAFTAIHEKNMAKESNSKGATHNQTQFYLVFNL